MHVLSARDYGSILALLSNKVNIIMLKIKQ